MAGDWIAMRHDLWECPQVVRILSAMCPQDVRKMSERCRIIGALYRTWCIFDRFTEDGILVGYTPEILNDEIGIAHWAENLQHVGWLVINEQSLTVPEFTEYFGESAKRRMKDAKRKRDSRKERPQNVRMEVDKMRTREQDRRKENNKKESKPKKSACVFVKPSLEEVTKYIAEHGYSVEPQLWLDHYEANGWRVGRNAMKDWKASVRTWAKNEYGGKAGNGRAPQDESYAEARKRIARTRAEYIESVRKDSPA